MAPGALLDSRGEAPHNLSAKQLNNNAPKDIFPDGIKTSGQHPPIYSKLKSYNEYPQEITGRTVWRAEDYQHNPERWVHRLTDDEKAELSAAADAFIASGLPLTGMTKDKFELPTLAKLMDEVREDVINGKGFNLMKGFPVEEWGNYKSAVRLFYQAPYKEGVADLHKVAYIGLGTYLGYFVSENSRGHILGHVQDLGDDPTQIDRVRIYRTNARQFFHADTSDIVGLLCIHRALEGGESDIASVHHVYNILQKERPDVIKTLTEPNWYFDRKGEVSKGQDEWIKTQILYIEPSGQGRVYCKWDPYFVRSLSRFSDAGKIPPLSPAQLEALQVLEDTCMATSLHMVLEVGDIQWLTNAHVLHSRTAYKDYAPPTPRRHLMRLWLATPESEGGWHLPFPDSDEKKRGGVQVNDTPPKYPLEGE